MDIVNSNTNVNSSNTLPSFIGNLDTKIELLATVELAKIRRNYAYRLSYLNLSKFLDGQVDWFKFNKKDRVYSSFIKKQEEVIQNYVDTVDSSS